MVLSKNKIKQIHSLELKKFRTSTQSFIAEGFKCVGELLKEGFQAKTIIATQNWKSPIQKSQQTEYIEVTDEELRKASLLPHPQQVLGIFQIPDINIKNDLNDIISKDLCLCLDGIQDPGNLGTIIRTADWFGIRHIICSEKTADAYSPKTVQATMGSIARVNIYYTDLTNFLDTLDKSIPIYGTLLDGENIYNSELSNNGIIIMGNEGNGISQEIRQRLTKHLLIPPYPDNSPTAESLNVAIATAIICSEFRRRC
jgi:TrmH family RNA methyltransferase